MPKTKNPCKDIPGYDESGNQLERGGPSRKAKWQKTWREKNKEYIKSYNAGYYLIHTVKKRLADKKAAKAKVREERRKAAEGKATMSQLITVADLIKADRVEGLTLAALATKYHTNRRQIGRILSPGCK